MDKKSIDGTQTPIRSSPWTQVGKPKPNPVRGKSRKFTAGTSLSGDTVGFAVPRGSGGYVAGVGRKIVAVDWSSQTMTSLTEVDKDKPNNRLNDGKVDPFGRLLTGKTANLSALLP